MPRLVTTLLARLNGWPRRLIAIACLLLAGVSALSGRVHRQTGLGVAVVVTARDLAVGARLAAGDLRMAQWPRQFVPPRAITTVDAAVGRRLAAALGRGEVITGTRLVGRDLATGLAADQVASTVIVSGNAGAMVHAGDRIELLPAPPNDPITDESTPSRVPITASSALIISDVQVLAVLDDAPSNDATAATLIVATTHAKALVLAGLVGSRVLAVLARSP